MVGSIIGFCGGGTTFPLVFGISIFPFGVVGIVVLDIMITYALATHRTFDIPLSLGRIVRQLFIYSILFVGFSILYYVNVLRNSLFHPFGFSVSFLSILVAFELIPWLSQKSEYFTTLFVRSFYRVNQVNHRITTDIHRAETFEYLVYVLRNIIEKSIGLTIKLLLVPTIMENPESSGFAELIDSNWMSVDLETGKLLDAIDKSLVNKFKVFDKTWIQESSDLVIQELMMQNGAGCIIPIVMTWSSDVHPYQHSTIGIILIEQRPGGYSYYDGQVFSSLGMEIGAALKGLRVESNRRMDHAKAKRLDNLKPLVVAVLHEVCSPLAAIKMGATMLNSLVTQGDLGSETGQKFQKLIRPVLDASERIALITERLRVFETLSEGDYVGGEKMLILDEKKWGSGEQHASSLG